MRHIILIAAVLICAACSLRDVRESPITNTPGEEAARRADRILELIDPRLARLEHGIAGLNQAADELAAARAREGRSEDAPLNFEEWLVIIGGSLAALLGIGKGTATYVEKKRNATRHQELAERDSRIEIAERALTSLHQRLKCVEEPDTPTQPDPTMRGVGRRI